MVQKEILENVILELRRGALVLAVLSQLEKEQYGYSLLKSLSDQGLGIDQGTLYPIAAPAGDAGSASVCLAAGRCPSPPLLCRE